MATLQQISTTVLMRTLYENPNAPTFPWNIGGATFVTRIAILNELANRSGQNDVSQIVSALPAVGTSDGATTTSGKSKIK